MVYKGVAVRTQGLRQTVRNLERLGVEAQDLREGFGRISERVAYTAQYIAPYRTGALSSRIKGSRQKNAAIVSSRQPPGGRPYHIFQNFGTSMVPARKYLARAVAQEIGFINDALDDALNEAIRRAGLGS